MEKSHLVGYLKDGKVYDLFQINNGKEIYLNTNDGLNIMRHTICHILAHALYRIYPNISFGIGPTTENGGFYIVKGITLSTKDFSKITQEMNKIINENISLNRTILSNHKIDELKQKIISKLSGEITVYEQGDFYDICKGPHCKSTGMIPKCFELIKVSEVTWENELCQKIEFIAFDTQERLDLYKQEYTEKELYDHRNLFKTMNLGYFSSYAPGFAFWKDRGYIIFNSLIEMIRKEYQSQDYINHECKTPIILSNELWKSTGHWDKYYENMFVLGDMSIKPMNCPGHAILFGTKSYRDLPYRIVEFGQVCRKEDHGGIQGLKRTLAFTIDDGHIFCREEHIESEIRKLLDLADKIYKKLNITNTRIIIATRPEKSIGTDAQWALAENALKKAVNDNYILAEGDGAFYGPKIEIQIQDNMNKWWTCGTIQIDYFLAERLDAKYIDENSKVCYPIIIHRAILGSLERFIGIYLEYTKGRLPFFCNPCQIRILPISEKSFEYANLIASKLKDYRYEIDKSANTINKKLKENRELKPYFTIIIGEKEIASQTLEIQHLNQKEVIALENLENYLKNV